MIAPSTDPMHALIIDDDTLILDVIEEFLGQLGIIAARALDVHSAKSSLDHLNFDLCITDLGLPDGSGFEVVHYIAANFPHLPVAVVTADTSTESAVAAMQAGAFDYLTKPLERDRLALLVTNAINLSANTVPVDQETLLVGQSPAIKAINAMAQRLAQTNAPVLITGESGSGKELVARTIHQCSPRRDAPFIAVNCGAIPENLMESEFFGHEKGSFTGADRRKPGLFVAAEGGTIFLDEIADLPLAMQVKMLRILQERAIRPVGSTNESPIDVRVLSASHKNLNTEVSLGRFREDLYYRVNVISIAMPSLKEHLEDIPQLTKTFLQKIASRDGKAFIDISETALAQLSKESWPGNVRELNNRLERAAALYQGHRIEINDVITPSTPTHDSQPQLSSIEGVTTALPVALPALQPYGKDSLDTVLAEVEKFYVLQAMETCKYNKNKASKLLGINNRSLRYRLQKFDIDY